MVGAGCGRGSLELAGAIALDQRLGGPVRICLVVGRQFLGCVWRWFRRMVGPPARGSAGWCPTMRGSAGQWSPGHSWLHAGCAQMALVIVIGCRSLMGCSVRGVGDAACVCRAAHNVCRFNIWRWWFIWDADPA